MDVEDDEQLPQEAPQEDAEASTSSQNVDQWLKSDPNHWIQQEDEPVNVDSILLNRLRIHDNHDDDEDHNNNPLRYKSTYDEIDRLLPQMYTMGGHDKDENMNTSNMSENDDEWDPNEFSVPTADIVGIVHTLRDADVLRQSAIPLCKATLSNIPSQAKFTLADPELGPRSRKQKCRTCNGDIAECPYHNGYIELAIPILDRGQRPKVVQWLKQICYHCGAPLIRKGTRKFATYANKPVHTRLHDASKTQKKNSRCDDAWNNRPRKISFMAPNGTWYRTTATCSEAKLFEDAKKKQQEKDDAELDNLAKAEARRERRRKLKEASNRARERRKRMKEVERDVHDEQSHSDNENNEDAELDMEDEELEEDELQKNRQRDDSDDGGADDNDDENGNDDEDHADGDDDGDDDDGDSRRRKRSKTKSKAKSKAATSKAKSKAKDKVKSKVHFEDDQEDASDDDDYKEGSTRRGNKKRLADSESDKSDAENDDSENKDETAIDNEDGDNQSLSDLDAEGDDDDNDRAPSDIESASSSGSSTDDDNDAEGDDSEGHVGTSSGSEEEEDGKQEEISHRRDKKKENEEDEENNDEYITASSTSTTTSSRKRKVADVPKIKDKAAKKKAMYAKRAERRSRWTKESNELEEAIRRGRTVKDGKEIPVRYDLDAVVKHGHTCGGLQPLYKTTRMGVIALHPFTKEPYPLDTVHMYRLIKNIPHEYLRFFGADPWFSHPKQMFLTAYSDSKATRVSHEQHEGDGRWSCDSMTKERKALIRYNANLAQLLANPPPGVSALHNYAAMDKPSGLHVASFFNGDVRTGLQHDLNQVKSTSSSSSSSSSASFTTKASSSSASSSASASASASTTTVDEWSKTPAEQAVIQQHMKSGMASSKLSADEYRERVTTATIDLIYCVNNILRRDVNPSASNGSNMAGGGGGNMSMGMRRMQSSGTTSKSQAQRLQGADGFMRRVVDGKRVNYNWRCVLSSAPELPLGVVEVPTWIMMEQDDEKTVNEYNIAELSTMVRNGPTVYPGAKYIIDHSGARYDLHVLHNRQLVLQYGWIVQCHLTSATLGDLEGALARTERNGGAPSLFNRQPSLHRPNMLGHVIRCRDMGLPSEERIAVIRMNYAAFAPQGADCDGDEINGHPFRYNGEKLEFSELIDCMLQTRLPSNGAFTYPPVQDDPLAMWFCTEPGRAFPWREALTHLARIKKKFRTVEGKLLEVSYWKRERITMDQPVLYPDYDLNDDADHDDDDNDDDNKEMDEEMDDDDDDNAVQDDEADDEDDEHDNGLDYGLGWCMRAYVTGGDLISMIFPTKLSAADSNETVDKAKTVHPTGHELGYWVQNGHLVSGILPKNRLTNLLLASDTDCGPDETGRFLHGITQLGHGILCRIGCTYGIKECQNPRSVETRDITDRAIQFESWVTSDGYKQKLLSESMSSSSQKKTIDYTEEAITDILDQQASKQIQKLLTAALVDQYLYEDSRHGALEQLLSGARGSGKHLEKTLATMGTTYTRGKRFTECPTRLIGLTMSHQKGYIVPGLFTGMGPSGKLIHLIPSRETVAAHATEIGEAGYAGRREVNGMRPAFTSHAGTVVSLDGHRFDSCYGGDGLDAAWIENNRYRPLMMDNETMVKTYSAKDLTVSSTDREAAEYEMKQLFKDRDLMRQIKIEGLRLDAPLLNSIQAPFSMERLILHYDDEMIKSNDDQHHHHNNNDSQDDGTIMSVTEVVGIVIQFVKSLAAMHNLNPQTNKVCILLRDWLSSNHVLTVYKWTRTKFYRALRFLESGYSRGKSHRGTNVGTLGAHSISQMLVQAGLDVFHSTGAKNQLVNQGFGRISELIEVAMSAYPRMRFALMSEYKIIKAFSSPEQIKNAPVMNYNTEEHARALASCLPLITLALVTDRCTVLYEPEIAMISNDTRTYLKQESDKLVEQWKEYNEGTATKTSSSTTRAATTSHPQLSKHMKPHLDSWYKYSAMVKAEESLVKFMSYTWLNGVKEKTSEEEEEEEEEKEEKEQKEEDNKKTKKTKSKSRKKNKSTSAKVELMKKAQMKNPMKTFVYSRMSPYVLRLQMNPILCAEFRINPCNVIALIHNEWNAIYKYHDSFRNQYAFSDAQTCIIRIRVDTMSATWKRFVKEHAFHHSVLPGGTTTTTTTTATTQQASSTNNHANTDAHPEQYILRYLSNRLLARVAVSGFTGISAAYVRRVDNWQINRDNGQVVKRDVWMIETEGDNMHDVCSTYPYIDMRYFSMSCVPRTEKAAGPYAASMTTFYEMKNAIGGIDDRHHRLMTRIMCHFEKMRGYNRYGVIKVISRSPSARALFETPVKVLTEAAQKNQCDYMDGIENSMMGQMQESGPLHTQVSPHPTARVRQELTDSRLTRVFKPLPRTIRRLNRVNQMNEHLRKKLQLLKMIPEEKDDEKGKLHHRPLQQQQQQSSQKHPHIDLLEYRPAYGVMHNPLQALPPTSAFGLPIMPALPPLIVASTRASGYQERIPESVPTRSFGSSSNPSSKLLLLAYASSPLSHGDDSGAGGDAGIPPIEAGSDRHLRILNRLAMMRQPARPIIMGDDTLLRINRGDSIPINYTLIWTQISHASLELTRHIQEANRALIVPIQLRTPLVDFRSAPVASLSSSSSSSSFSSSSASASPVTILSLSSMDEGEDNDDESTAASSIKWTIDQETSINRHDRMHTPLSITPCSPRTQQRLLHRKQYQTWAFVSATSYIPRLSNSSDWHAQFLTTIV